MDELLEIIDGIDRDITVFDKERLIKLFDSVSAERDQLKQQVTDLNQSLAQAVNENSALRIACKRGLCHGAQE